MLTMRRAALALFFLACAAPAWAGSLTLTATTAQGTLSHSITIPDAHFARVVAAYKALLTLDPASTNAQVFQALARGLFNGIRDNVQNYERNQARISAETGVSPLDMQ